MDIKTKLEKYNGKKNSNKLENDKLHYISNHSNKVLRKCNFRSRVVLLHT